MRILIADHDASARSALKVFFRAHPELELVGEAADLEELVAEVDGHAPDVVILDWDTLGEQIDAFLILLQQLDEPPAVVVMSVRAENRKAAMETGVAGFAHKGEPPECLLAAVRAASRERKPLTEREEIKRSDQ